MDTLSKPTDYTTPRVSPDTNYGLWVIMLCGFRFLNGNKCTTQVGGVDNGGGDEGVGAGGRGIQFCCEPKTSLKRKVY